jgi:hypothetical protein
MPTYKGQTVNVLRPATNKDPGFKDDKTEQVVISTSDGTEKTVPKEEVK